MADLTSTQIIDSIRTSYLNVLTAIPGRDAVPGAAAGAAPVATRNMKAPWNKDQFLKLATGTAPVGTGLGVEPAAGSNWDDYLATAYNATRIIKNTNPVPDNSGRDMARNAVLIGDLRLLNGNARSTGLMSNLMKTIFDGDLILSKSKKFIYNVPKSDELLQRFVTPLFMKSLGYNISTANPAGAAASVLTNEAAILPHMKGTTYQHMPLNEYEFFKSLLNLTPQDIEALKKYDAHVDEIHEALSQGVVADQTPISPANVVPAVARNSISAFSSYPAGLQEVLKEKRKSDQSNPLNASATLGRIRVVMNGGADRNNLVGGNASKSAPLYPKFVMHGGAHPLAIMEGGASNPVAVLEARIAELKRQFKAATAQDLDKKLSNDINGYATNIKTNIESVQTALKELSAANAALAQYPVGLGINPSTMTQPQLTAIAEKAEKVNKDAANAQKQVDKLSAIVASLEELVNKSKPAPRT